MKNTKYFTVSLSYAGHFQPTVSFNCCNSLLLFHSTDEKTDVGKGDPSSSAELPSKEASQNPILDPLH